MDAKPIAATAAAVRAQRVSDSSCIALSAINNLALLGPPI